MDEREKACQCCRHCIEGTSIFDGSTILFCYDVKGREGVELIVDEEEMCDNFKQYG